MKWRKRVIGVLGIAYVFFWLGGVISHVFLGGPPAHVTWTAPLFLAIAGCVVLVASDVESFFRLLVVGAIGLIAEFVGVHTRYPFGAYQYSAILCPLLFGVPVVMTSAWFVLAAFWRQVLSPLRLSGPLHLLIFALMVTMTDLVIDPLAAGPLGYWIWNAPGWYYGIPASNFAGWLFVSTLIGIAAGTATQQNVIHWGVGISIVAFFAILAAANSMWLAAGIGAGLIALAVVAHQRTRMCPIGAPASSA